MPLYEFHCNKCDSDFERFTKIADKDAVLTEPCPHCAEVGDVYAKMSAIPLVDPVRLGVSGPPKALRERLEAIKKNTHKSDMSGGSFS